MTLNLEQLAFEHGNNSQLKSKRDISDCYEFEPVVSPQQVSQTRLSCCRVIASLDFFT
jgi:hypothetical protein